MKSQDITLVLGSIFAVLMILFMTNVIQMPGAEKNTTTVIDRFPWFGAQGRSMNTGNWGYNRHSYYPSHHSPHHPHHPHRQPSIVTKFIG